MTGKEFEACVLLENVFYYTLRDVCPDIYQYSYDIISDDCDDYIKFKLCVSGGFKQVWYSRKLIQYLNKELSGIHINYDKDNYLKGFLIKRKDIHNLVTYYRMRGVI